MSKRILPKVKEIFGDVNEIAGEDITEPKSHRILDYLEGIAENTGKIAESGGGGGGGELPEGTVIATDEDIDSLFK